MLADTERIMGSGLLNELIIVRIDWIYFDFFGMTLYENKNTISLDYVKTIWLVAEIGDRKRRSSVIEWNKNRVINVIILKEWAKTPRIANLFYIKVTRLHK